MSHSLQAEQGCAVTQKVENAKMKRISLQRIKRIKPKKPLVYISIFEFMTIGVLVSFIENNYHRLLDAPTVGLTMFLVGIIALMFYIGKNRP